MLALPPLARDQVRRVDQVAIQQFGLSGPVLMENAGRGAADRIQQLYPIGPIALLCGTGNNGGDGFVIARHLDAYGRSVQVIVIGDVQRISADAAVNYHVLQRSQIAIAENPDADRLPSMLTDCLIVDALLGTGARGDPRSNVALAIEAANQSASQVIAIDLPSGLDCDTGHAGRPCIRAAHTLTFVAPKLGFTHGEGPVHVGQVHVLPIGVPACLLREMHRST